MKRTQKDRDEDLALGRELERKDAEIERLRAVIDEIHVLAGRQGPENDIEALNQIEATAAAALLYQQQGGSK